MRSQCVGLISLIFLSVCHAQPASPPVRDVYGDPVPEFALARLGTTRLRHGSRVENLQFSADGKLLTSIADSHMYVWESATGKLVRRENLTGLDTLRVSSDTILIGEPHASFDKQKLWKITELNSQPPDPIVRDPNQVFPANAKPASQPTILLRAISPDGTILATVHRNSGGYSEIQLWKFEPGKKLTDLEPLDRKWRLREDAIGLLFSGDGKRLLVITNGGATTPEPGADVADRPIELMVCSVDGPRHARKITVPRPTEFNGRALTVAPDGQSFATASKDRKLRFYRFDSTTPFKVLDVPKVDHNDLREIIVLRYSPDGKLLAVAGTANRIWIWDLESETIVKQLDGHRSWVETLDFSPDGKTLASGAQDGAIRLWDVASGEEKDQPVGHEYWVFGAAFSPDGRFAVTSCADATTRVWDAASGKLTNTIEHDSEWATSCEFIPGTKLLATADLNGVQLRDFESNKVVWQSELMPNGNCKRLSTSANGERFAAIVSDHAARIWDRSGEQVQLVAEIKITRKEKDATIAGARLLPDGNSIVLATETTNAGSTMIEFWDLSSSKKANDISVEKGGVRDFRFSRNGKLLVTCGYCTVLGWDRNNKNLASPNLEDSVILWDLKSDEPIRKFGLPNAQKMKQSRRFVKAVALTSDNQFLLTAERDGNVVVYAVETGEQVAVLRGHAGSVSNLALSPDQKKCLSVSSDTTGLIWDLDAVLAR